MAVLGIVEVFLIAGKGLKNVEFLGDNDPYALISYKTQDQKSKTLEAGGSNPAWKQRFFFEVDEEVADVIIKVYDEDKRTADDLIGEARIPLAKVVEELEVPANLYDLVRPSGRTHGQLEVSLKFEPKVEKPKRPPASHGYQNGHSSSLHNGPYGENNEGGWQ
ncbi:hypothetical protein GOP47_0029285 [Adiantum capillus-veneris]|nr:hypothetical protein GOP47_0029285 [Adiantum capillus-veneris]